MQYVTLNDGNKMPQVGLGLFQLNDAAKVEQAIKDAIDVGYRLFDTATIYDNEANLGKIINRSGIGRNEFFITSKLWLVDYPYEKAKKAINISLKNLGTNYIDLYLLHQPYGDIAGAWCALIEAQKEGKIKSIGVSNFYPDQVKNLELMSGVKPAVNQIEVSPWYQRSEDVIFNQEDNVAVEAWAPFSQGRGHIFTNDVLHDIGKKHNRTNAQVILRWLIQRGLIVIPRSVHQARMAENIDVFDFELSDEDMSIISQLDKKESQFFDHRNPEAIESIFGSSLKEMND